MEVIVFDVISRKNQLDWIGHQHSGNDTFYIKPIFDASLSEVHTLHHLIHDRDGLTYGLLGEWKCQNPLDAMQLTQIKSNFNRLVTERSLPSDIVPMVYETIRDVPFAMDVSLLMWIVNQEKNLFTLISKNFNHVFVSRINDEKGRLRRYRLEGDKQQNLLLHQEALSALKQLVLPTNTYGIQAIKRFEKQVYNVDQPDVFNLVGLINQSYNMETQPKTSGPHALIMDFETFESVNTYTLRGLESHQTILERILQKLPNGFDVFEVKLVFSELVSNAFKHGNQNHPDQPIKVIVSYTEKHCYIEVYDMRASNAHIEVPTSLDPSKILDECGRGLFLVQSVSESVYVDQNSTTAKLKKQEVVNV